MNIEVLKKRKRNDVFSAVGTNNVVCGRRRNDVRSGVVEEDQIKVTRIYVCWFSITRHKYSFCRSLRGKIGIIGHLR